MRILAIETSCDDTGVSILEVSEDKNPDFKVLSNIVSSQTIHQNYGGVFPMMAKREHQRNLVPVLMRALKQAKLLNPKSEILNSKQIQNFKFQTINSILKQEPELLKQIIPFLEKYEKPAVDLIAATNGPGLEPCLWVGVNLAKALSYFWNIPIIPVNHIESHILVNFLPKINENSKSETLNPKSRPRQVVGRGSSIKSGQISNSKLKIQNLFPAVCLVVSGGHTQLILIKDIGKYKIIGETRDDAAGECFDKCAKILGLGYPGGPVVAHIAEQWKSKIKKEQAPIANKQISKINLPRPMVNSKDYDFSFSGLKTAVLYKVKSEKLKAKREIFIQEMCFEVQQAIIDVLIKKTIKAEKDFKVKAIILGGGVSANTELRKQLKEKIKKEIPNTICLTPDIKHSTDNALMIAMTAYFHRTKKKHWQSLKASANLRVGK